MSTSKYILDTSVLLNFGVIGRFGLLLQFAAKQGVVAAFVYEEELRHPRTRQALQTAVQNGDIEVAALDSEFELMLFAKLLADRAIGEGEAETIAASVSRGWVAVIDDWAARERARRLLPRDRLMDTHDVLRALIARGILTRTDAVTLNEAMRRAGRRLPPFG